MIRFLNVKHRHEWQPVGSNGFGEVVEEMCWACGTYRHRLLKFGSKPDGWVEGRHPKRT